MSTLFFCALWFCIGQTGFLWPKEVILEKSNPACPIFQSKYALSIWLWLRQKYVVKKTEKGIMHTFIKAK
jgi:hypothetical protein